MYVLLSFPRGFCNSLKPLLDCEELLPMAVAGKKVLIKVGL